MRLALVVIGRLGAEVFTTPGTDFLRGSPPVPFSEILNQQSNRRDNTWPPITLTAVARPASWDYILCCMTTTLRKRYNVVLGESH